jgi:hypothetical protein
MNNRIEELLTPKLKEWGGDSGDNFSEELEKFAELIIQECADILVNNHPLDCTLSDGYYYPNLGRHQGAEEIKNHFRVK